MKLKYSFLYFLFNSVIPLIIMVYLFVERSNENKLDGYIIFICILFVFLSLITAYKFFFGYIVKIDNNEITAHDYYIQIFEKKFEMNSISKITVRRNIVTIYDGPKKLKINKRNIKKSDLQNFYKELTMKTGLEIKSYT